MRPEISGVCFAIYKFVAILFDKHCRQIDVIKNRYKIIMGTFLTILGLFAVIFFGKFIYDTYLTDNTERDFEEYRKSDPIAAAKIEKPKKNEQFTNLINAVSDDLYNKPINLTELFPDFVKGLTQMKIMTDSPFKLELESIGNDIRVFLTIQQNLEDREFYFHASMMDKDSEFYSSEKFRLGSRVTIVTSPPNWDKLIPDAIMNIYVKKTRQRFEKIITEEQKKLTLRFDGYYSITNIDGSGATLVLRFYPDGMVIYVKLMGDPYMITSWFKRDNEKVQKGNYKLINNVFDFTASSIQRGSSYFVGYVKDNRHIHLQVDGTREVEFGFLQIDENKTYNRTKQYFPDKEDFYIDFD